MPDDQDMTISIPKLRRSQQCLYPICRDNLVRQSTYINNFYERFIVHELPMYLALKLLEELV